MLRPPSDYLNTADEDALQAMLAEDLSRNGWQVYREVDCVAPFVMSTGNGKQARRRVDLWAMATETKGDDPQRAIRAGMVVVVVLKYSKDGGRNKAWHIAEQQAISAVMAHDYHLKGSGGRGGRPLRRPDMVLVADQLTLGRAVQVGPDRERDRLAEDADTRLWRSGCAVLWRYAGGLRFRQHVARVEMGRWLVLSRDSWAAK